MLYKFYFLLFLLFTNNILSFKNKILIPILNHDLKTNMKPNDLINYLTSIKDYTIITIGDKSKNLENLMINKNLKVYYVDLNNLLNKDELLIFLKEKYNTFEVSDDLWIFYQGFYIGCGEDIHSLINKK